MTAVAKAATLYALGLRNLLRVGLYRLGLRSGLHPVLRIAADVPQGPFFTAANAAAAGALPLTTWRDSGLWFSYHEFPLAGDPPDWFANPFRPGVLAEAAKPWHRISDFNPALGDIKTVWEASRFDWLLAMATRAAAGDGAELDRLNHWLADWANCNPPYQGVNWKCGQESSIRVMHLAAAALVLGQAASPAPGLRDLVRLHLRRIAPTMGYAIGQANNHGTSEAAALFIGGSWLADDEGRAWAATGRYWLEDRARRLIAADGTFSQYSTIYHRVMLDTYALAEIWRRRQAQPKFSAGLRARLAAAVGWLAALTDPVSGDAPNLGANDGARLLPLGGGGFRDFRPALQLAAALFCDARVIGSTGPWDQPGLWLRVQPVTAPFPQATNHSFDDGGLHLLRHGTALAVLRYPRFRFRPSHADALHLDLWLDGVNLLRDSGTFSYADPAGTMLAGTMAHNTVSFDDRDQMPRLGRFLFGSWLRARGVWPVRETPIGISAAAGYRDHAGALHHRQVDLGPHGLLCTDEISGHFSRAVLRWRLAPGAWQLSKGVLSDGRIHLRIIADVPLTLRLVEGRESRHYLSMTPLPVLEAEVTAPGRLTTEIRF